MMKKIDIRMTAIVKQVRTILRKQLLIFTAALVCMPKVQAIELNKTESVKGESDFHTDERSINLGSGRNFRYQLDYILNQHGEREVQISLVEAHWLAKDTKLSVLRGRDSNADGLIDAWYYSEGAIVKSLRQTAESADAWPTAEKILRSLQMNEPRWLSTLIARELLATLFFTVEGEINDAKELEEIQINLIDLEYKIGDLEANNDNPVLIHELKRVEEDGWKHFLDRWTRTRLDDRHLRMLGDLSLFVGFSIALKGAKFLLAKSLSSETISSVKLYVKNTIQEQKAWTEKITYKVGKVSPLKKKVPTEKTPLTLESSKSASSIRFGSESEALAWLSRQTAIAKVMKNIGGFMKNAAVASWDNRGYIAMAQTLQLAVESYNRGYWKFSEAPLVLDHPVASTKNFIQQVSTDKGLLQNLSYMTLQTALLSGVSESLERSGANMKVKYAVCSIITLLDSTNVNILIQGKTDYPRIAFDTAWELVVGGSQIHLDLHLLRWANGLADKYKNPKLKLVGYLLGSIDQTTGYFLYNKATANYFEPNKTLSIIDTDAIPPVILVPVLAPAAAAQGSTATAAPAS